jgi:hypothetical protein
VSWFRADASALLERVNDYMRILEAHGVPIEIARTDGPGRIVNSDTFQVVACPIPNGHRSQLRQNSRQSALPSREYRVNPGLWPTFGKFFLSYEHVGRMRQPPTLQQDGEAARAEHVLLTRRYSQFVLSRDHASGSLGKYG